MKKILELGVVTAMFLASTPISYADAITVKDPAQASSISVSNDISVSNEAKAQDDPIITPLDVKLISPFHYSSVNAYENTFYMDPRNGLTANLWLQNTGSGTIYMKVYTDDVYQFEVSFAPGEQKTTEFYGTKGHNRKIYVYNSTGIVNDFNISARQF
ncbi:hypothetical protein ACE6ED_13455 [Paenibacillus sp. CN-4]|uniref:hypothetical protein n=1 Tax=Paenibacillus nanchangensis TaxID=3348343 RepID=UPI0039784BCB